MEAQGPGQLAQDSLHLPVVFQRFTPSTVSAAPAFVGGGSRPKIEVKLFVGRLPTTSTEASVRALFQPHGEVAEVAIIRDKATGVHKGAAFVRMVSITQADVAVRALHNTAVLDADLGPLQVSYATGEAERLGFNPGSLTAGEDEAKVFVGSLPRDVTEADVENFFSRFGKAYDAYLMRDAGTKRFKGCGFVKFAMKEEALLAIKQLHGSVTFPGASRPLEVRVAEPKKAGGVSRGGQGQGHGQGGNAGQGAQAAISQGSLWGQRTGVPVTQLGVQMPGYTQRSNANPRAAGAWKEYFSPEGRAYYHNEQTGVTQWEVPGEFLQETTGPPGANIFVFHVPNEWGRDELAAHFMPFGRVLSAKVVVDNATNRNKGYGFVSYDDVRSALQAVQHMNQVNVGGKKLRVAIKNGEEDAARKFAEQLGAISGYPSGGPNNAAVPGMHMSGYAQLAQAVGGSSTAPTAGPTPAQQLSSTMGMSPTQPMQQSSGGGMSVMGGMPDQQQQLGAMQHYTAVAPGMAQGMNFEPSAFMGAYGVANPSSQRYGNY